MNKLFVPYELAVLLKEKGFKEPCLTYWFTTKEVPTPLLRLRDVDLNGYINKKDPDYNTTAPMYSQVVDWLRDKHKFHVGASPFPIYKDKYGYRYSRSGDSESGYSVNFEGKTHYDALHKAIEEVLKFIK